MFYYISSLILNLSPWGYCLFSSSVEKTRRSPFLGLVFFLLLAMGTWPADSAHPANVGLQWDASTDPNVSAYKIYFGKTSRSYGSPVDVGSTTGCTISGLEDGATYYFAATAIDTAGDESGYSNEAIHTTPGGCTPSLSPANQSFGASGGSGSVTLTAGSDCAWTALSNASWILLTSNSAGTGPYALHYSVSANSSSSARSGTLTVAGQTFTVSQSGAGCAFSISPASLSTGAGASSGTVSVTAASGCTWSASSGAAWISINSGGSGSGNGACGYSIGANSGSSSRTGSLTVAGKTFTVTQQGVLQYTLTINKSGTAGGTVTSSPQGSVFNSGTAVTLTAIPDSNASFAGWSGACTGNSSTCSLTMTANRSVTAAFNLKSFTISASAGAGGSLSPQGQVPVNVGSSQNFTITPAEGYRVEDVKVDGASVGAVSTYLFGNVMAAHAITANFTALPLPPAPSSLIVALNAGGPEYTDSAGNRFEADRYYSGGTAGVSAESITGTRDPLLYQSDRYGSFSYAIPVSNGIYDVTLKFVEKAFSSKGKRIFNVFLEDHQVIENLDTYSAAGKNVALDFTFRGSVSDGVLNLNFVPSVGDAQVSAIRVNKASSTPPVNPNGKVKKYYSLQQRTAEQPARIPETGH